MHINRGEDKHHSNILVNEKNLFIQLRRTHINGNVAKEERRTCFRLQKRTLGKITHLKAERGEHEL